MLHRKRRVWERARAVGCQCTRAHANSEVSSLLTINDASGRS